MYVADMTLADAEATLEEVMDLRIEAFKQGRDVEQLDWDIEDLAGRILELRSNAWPSWPSA